MQFDLRSSKKRLISGLSLLLPLLAAGEARAQDFKTQIRAPETTKWKWFGNTVALDSNTLVVSAPESIRNGDTSNCSLAYIGYGAIAVYKKGFNGNWNYAQKFWHDPPPTTSDNEVKFGRSISLRGNVLVVSAERQDYSADIHQAGGFTVFTRGSSSQNFTRQNTYFGPNPQTMQRLGDRSGVSHNASYIVVGDAFSTSYLVYRIQGTSVTYAYSVPMPVPAPPGDVFLTNNNVLVGMIQGYPTLLAYALTANGYTTLDTSSLAQASLQPEAGLAGDGNTVVVTLRDDQTFRPVGTQVVNFSSSGIAWSDTRMFAPGLFLEENGYSAKRMTIKEGSGFFASYNRYIGDVTTTFLTGFKYSVNAGTGHDYNYQGVVVPASYWQLGNDTNPADGLAFNGTDLVLGDTTVPQSTFGGACGSDSTGGVDLFTLGPVATAGPGSSTKLQPWLTSSAGVGSVVASSPGYAVVSSSYVRFGDLGLSGQAILYRKVGTQWEELERYLDGLAGLNWSSRMTGFGASAAINSRSIFIGAPQGFDSNLGTTGQVYYANAANGGYQHGPMNTPLWLPGTVNDGDNFGSSLAVDNVTLLAGAVLGGSDDVRNGSVYVYNYDSNFRFWFPGQELQPPSSDVQPWMAFGSQVAISGDFAAVSAPLFDSNGLFEPGAVYVFRRTNGTFNFFQRLMAPTPSNSDDFGQSVAVSGNFIAASGNNTGVRLFRLNTAGTAFVSDGSVSVSGMQYAPVALTSSGLLVSTPNDARIRRFTRSGNNAWNLGGTFTGPLSEGFGTALAMSGSDVVIGATATPVGQFTPGVGFATTFSGIQ